MKHFPVLSGSTARYTRLRYDVSLLEAPYTRIYKLTLTSDLMMGLSMRPLRKMRSVSLAPTLPFRSSIFSRTCWKAAVTRETNYSDQDTIVCNWVEAFVVVTKNLDSRRQPRLFTQDVNPQTWRL